MTYNLHSEIFCKCSSPSSISIKSSMLSNSTSRRNSSSIGDTSGSMVSIGGISIMGIRNRSITKTIAIVVEGLGLSLPLEDAAVVAVIVDTVGPSGGAVGTIGAVRKTITSISTVA